MSDELKTRRLSFIVPRSAFITPHSSLPPLTAAAASLTLACVSTPEIPFPESSIEDPTPTPGAGAGEPNPDSPPWGILGALGVWAASFVFMLVLQLAFVVGYMFYRRVPLIRAAEFITKDPSAIFVAILSLVPAHALTLLAAWLLVTGVGKRPFLRALGWDWTRGFTFWRCAGLAVLLLVAGAGIIKVAGSPETELDRLIESSRAAALATAFLATVTAPLVEEVIYRGVLYSALRRAAGKRWAVAVVVLLFAAIHVPQYWPSFGVIATILLLSYVLTDLRARTGRLLPCFIVHLVFNGIQSALIVLNPYIEHLSPDKTPAPPPAPGALLHLALQLFASHF
jgi:membrane protease YdiL (CAAX protease family)